jgi:hypothetical protein
VPPPYSAVLLASIERTITKERLTRYLGATGQGISKALVLYEYNVQLSEVLYGLLHGLEVMVRNAAHHALTASYRTAAWYDAAPLSLYWQDLLAKAKAKPGAAGKPGKVIAELTLGFWVELVSKPNHNRLFNDLETYSGLNDGIRTKSEFVTSLSESIRMLSLNGTVEAERLGTTGSGMGKGWTGCNRFQETSRRDVRILPTPPRT